MWHRITRSLSINMALGVLAFLSLVSAASLMRQAIQISRDSATAARRLDELTAHKKELEAAIRTAGMEEAVRYKAKARLNLKNPGENIVVVLPDKKEIPPAGGGESVWWKRITSFFSRIISR